MARRWVTLSCGHSLPPAKPRQGCVKYRPGATSLWVAQASTVEQGRKPQGLVYALSRRLTPSSRYTLRRHVRQGTKTVGHVDSCKNNHAHNMYNNPQHVQQEGHGSRRRKVHVYVRALLSVEDDHLLAGVHHLDPQVRCIRAGKVSI